MELWLYLVVILSFNFKFLIFALTSFGDLSSNFNIIKQAYSKFLAKLNKTKYLSFLNSSPTIWLKEINVPLLQNLG